MRICALALVAGCLYNGEFRDGTMPFAGKRVTFDCLDLAVTQTDDARATGPVIAFEFGDHCFHQTHVDLSSVHVIGHYGDGTRAMVAYDPKHELRPMQLDALSSGREEIEYLDPEGSRPVATCVDVGHIEPRATANAHWLCFGSWDLGADTSFTSPRPTAASLDVASATDTGWPLPPAIDPEVTEMPARAQLSIGAVGGYLARRISNKLRLVKALHDFVTLRLDYDDDAKAAIDRKQWDAVPSQEAEAVFASRRGVCAGYAKLLSALGRAAGVDIRYVTGQAGDDQSGARSTSSDHAHAWNAAEIDGRWVLVDATWDDSEHGAPSSQYLFMPPGLFGVSHVPDDPGWQLVAPPLTIDELVNQPWVQGHR